MTRLAALAFPVVLGLLFTGCVNVVHAYVKGREGMRQPRRAGGRVEVYASWDEVPGDGFCFANIGAHSQSVNSYEALALLISRRAYELGADFALLTTSETTSTFSVSTIANVTTVSETKLPHQYGLACGFSAVTLGAQWVTASGLVTRVLPQSAAAKAGIDEGDTIFALNDRPLASDPQTVAEELFMKEPGDTLTIKYFRRNGKKVVKTIKLPPSRHHLGR